MVCALYDHVWRTVVTHVALRRVGSPGPVGTAGVVISLGETRASTGNNIKTGVMCEVCTWDQMCSATRRTIKGGRGAGLRGAVVDA